MTRVREIEEELLREYLPVILENSERILDTPGYFYCRLAAALLSSPWVYGGGPIPLGVLLLLWDAGEMRFTPSAEAVVRPSIAARPGTCRASSPKTWTAGDLHEI